MLNADTLKQLTVFSLFAILGAYPSAQAADLPVLRTNIASPVQIIQISPSQGDLGGIERKRKRDGIQHTNEIQVHVIKLYVKMPPPAAEAHALYIGDERIPEYGGFNEGIFFKVYDSKQLESWQRKPVRMQYRKELIDLGVSMPVKTNQASALLPSLGEVLKRDK